MQIWLELLGAFPERAGKYLICPIHTRTKQHYHTYKILEEPRRGDIVFHYVLQKASNKPSAYTSYSRVANSCYIADNEQDSLCTLPPPYRKIDLVDYKLLNRPITHEMLLPFKEELEAMPGESTRFPYNKHFQMKQLYLSRIPFGFLKYFEKLSGTKLEI